MKLRTPTLATLLFALILTLVAACGTQPVALADIPVYPGATELKPGESPIGDTLGSNNQQDALLRSQLNLGGKTEQKGFQMPAGVTWDQVRSFYDEQLKQTGWASNNLVGGILEQANQGNDSFRIANWQRDKQNVSVILLALPTTPDQQQLIVSLSTQ